MPIVRAQVADRDRAIYDAWCRGVRQRELAEQHGLSQSAISQAIGRHLATLPPVDRAAELDRSLAQINRLLQVYLPLAEQRNTAANREVRGLLQLKGRFLGMDRREVHVEGTVEHQYQVWQPGPTVDQVLAEWREQGLITFRPTAELTRSDR